MVLDQYKAGNRPKEGKGEDSTYQDKGPGNVEFFLMKVVNEEDEDTADDDGGDKLTQP